MDPHGTTTDLAIRERCVTLCEAPSRLFLEEGSSHVYEPVAVVGTDDFQRFVADVRPRLVRAFVGHVGVGDAADAAAEALAYAFEHWDRVRAMDNPAGYLYRVGRSRIRHRRAPALPKPTALGIPDVEPMLIPALLALPESQRMAVWLVHACQWHYAEVAEAMHTSTSMVGNHVSRGMSALRRRLGASSDA